MDEAAESPAAPTLDARPGLAFAGRYRIIRLLGRGDRKSTYLALDTYVERQVALALIKPEAARFDPSGTRREVEALWVRLFQRDGWWCRRGGCWGGQGVEVRDVDEGARLG